MDTNVVIMTGNLAADPQSRFTPAGKQTTTFRIVSNRVYTNAQGQQVEEATGVNVVTWNGVAKACGQYLAKGRKVLVEGRLSIRKYQKDGQDHWMTEIIANTVQFLGGPKTGERVETETPEPDFGDEQIPF